jgi:carbamoyltransferase
MYVLGINSYYHDSAAALVKDGELIVAVEEERFNRIKHSPNVFSHNAIDFCLKYANIKLTDLDHIAYFMNQNLIVKKFWRFQPYFNRLWYKPWKFFGGLYMFKQKDKLVEGIAKKAHAKLYFVEHHLAHAASAYYGSKFKKTNILTIDGRGELISSLLAEGNSDELEKLQEIPLPHSLGNIYTALTDFMGFRPQDGEGKVMGLAPYGKDKFSKAFDKIVWPTKDGFKTNPDYYWGFLEDWGGAEQRYYTDKLCNLLGRQRAKEEPINNHYEHIAYSLQKKTEDIGVHLAKLLYEKTGYKNLCIAGGVALNAKMNGIIAQQDFIDNFYVQPAATDSGSAIGAAFYVYHKITGKRPKPIDNVFLGAEYSDADIKKALDKCKVEYKKSPDISGEVAELLSKNKIIGWFQGRMELGPRALGSRSILVNPANKKMIFTLNYYVKNRELWRPFALSMLYEDRKKYLRHGWDSPFMIIIDEVPEERRKELIAGVHVDGTTRPQTLQRKQNPLYYDLIKKFGKITGTPVVLNTSFNLAGEPIVNTPAEAIKDFYGSGMDYLAIGNYLVKK